MLGAVISGWLGHRPHLIRSGATVVTRIAELSKWRGDIWSNIYTEYGKAVGNMFVERTDEPWPLGRYPVITIRDLLLLFIIIRFFGVYPSKVLLESLRLETNDIGNPTAYRNNTREPNRSIVGTVLENRSQNSSAKNSILATEVIGFEAHWVEPHQKGRAGRARKLVEPAEDNKRAAQE